jgi:hypothetical protein
MLGLVRSISEGILGCLDWLVRLAERLIVLGLAFVILRFGYRLIFWPIPPDATDWITKIAANWKAVILLLIPLFYRTVRIFLEQVEEAFGMKRPPQKSSEEEEAE